MIILNGKRNDTDAVRKLWDECFPEDSIEWRDWYFKNIYDIENVIGTKHAGQLASMVHMNPYPILMRGSKINAYALSGVATQENLRGQGFAGNLIKYSLNKAYKLGYDFSFLYPFKYEYYEKFGYKLAYEKHKYQQNYYEGHRSYEMKTVDMFDAADFQKIYNKFVYGKNGFVLRDAEYFEKHIKELLCDENNLVCFSIFNERGYFCADKDLNKIEELAYEGELSEAIKSIVGHYKKDITFENLIEYDKLIGVKEPHCMGRVISVEGIFSKLVCRDINIKIRVSDDIIKENDGVWHIFSNNGRAQAKKVNGKADYTVDIAQLAPIVTGLPNKDNDNANRIMKLLFQDTLPFIYEVC